MKFRLAFTLISGLLLSSSVAAADDSVDSSSPSTVVTTVEATSEPTPVATSTGAPAVPSSSPAAPGSSAAPGSPTSPITSGSSEFPASSASPVTGGPSGAPQTTVSPASGGTTQLPVSGSTNAPITKGGSTVSAGPTTTAPLPNVTYSLLQFGAPVCIDATCTYEIDAPKNDQALLATDQTIIANDRSQFGALQASASSIDVGVKKANDDAVAKINEIQSMLNQMQKNLNTIQQNIAIIQQQQDDASGTLIFVEKFITSVNNAQGCLYQRCLRPTTPAPPTTTPTPAPTTPPSPCMNFTCPDSKAPAHCNLDTYNKPSCDNCPGNFDGYTACKTVACSASGTNLTVDSNGNVTWYSTGYDQTSPNNSLVPAGANCVWKLDGLYQLSTTTPSMNLTCLNSGNVQISFVNSDNSFSQQISSGTTARSLNSLLRKVENGSITLTSTASVPTFCSIALTKQKSSGAMFEELEVEKKNGFFSWLMGY